MIKVLIVEDHASMRESLTTALTAAGDFTVVGEVPNADYALDFCKHLRPDLVLMDVCTENGASGLKAVEATRATILLALIFYSYTPKLYFFTPSVFQKGISPLDAINPLKKSVMVPSITYSSKKQLSPTYKYLFILDFVSSITRL